MKATASTKRDLAGERYAMVERQIVRLPEQFDDYIWFDRSRAITPLQTEKLTGMPDTYPFGL